MDDFFVPGTASGVWLKSKKIKVGMCMPIVLVGVWMNSGDLVLCHIVSGVGPIS